MQPHNGGRFTSIRHPTPRHRGSRMLSPKTDRRGARLLLIAGIIFAGLMFTTFNPARAEAVKTNSSLSFIPGDAGFYASSLRNKEQFDLLYKSNAYKSLRALPLVKMAHDQIMTKLKEGGEQSPLKMLEGFTKDKDNKELVELALDLGGDELFIYGGKTFGDLFQVMSDVSNANTLSPLKALLDGNDSQKAQMRGMLLALQNKRATLKIPDLVIGAKIKDPKKAAAQIKRLEKILGGLEEFFPPLKGKVDRQKVAGGDFLSINVDGSMIPWDDVNLKDFEDKKDEFADLLKHLKKMTLSINLGVKGEYLLFSISSTAKDIEKLDGKQPSLAEADEMKPLAKFADKPLTGVSYVSKDFLKSAAGNADYTQLAEALKEALQKVDQVKEDRKKAIGKDLDALVADFKKLTPNYGARMAFSFMTETGYEGYSYDYTKYTHLGDTKLTLHNHFGGDPIFAAAVAFSVDGSAYKTTVKWLKIIHGHAEAVFLEMAPEEAKEPYEKFTKAVFPVLKKIDENTTKKFFPSIKDSGLGIVLDGKWSSKQWFKYDNLPATPKAMPMAELGLLVGISDAKMFEDALKSYRLLFNELFEAFRGAAPANDNIPEIKIPAPERDKGKNGVLIYYPIPEELGIDKQVQPVAGIGKSLSVLAMSKAHAERLMASTPLKLESKPLARKGNLIGVSVVNWPGLVDTAHPWIEMGVRNALLEFKGPKEFEAESVMTQLKVVLAALKTFKSASSATYVEDGKIVSHTEIIIKDLARQVPAKEKE